MIEVENYLFQSINQHGTHKKTKYTTAKGLNKKNTKAEIFEEICAISYHFIRQNKLSN